MERKFRTLARSRISGGFFPHGVRDRDRFVRALEDMSASLGETGAFCGDNLITWGRNLSFALDTGFMEAFRKASPDPVEAGLIWRVYLLYWAARRGLGLQGDFVEAACYRGFSARVIADAIGLAQTDKRYWLYDRFDMADDPSRRLSGHNEHLFDQVQARFSDLPNVRIIKGSIPESFNKGAPETIAFMHIDMNNADAEIATLEHFYDRVVPGGTIIFDDYGWGAYREQKDAEDAWLAKRGNVIVELPTGQGLLIK